MDGMRIAQLWRYPVKSLRGETLERATLTADGVEGDRRVHVAGRRGPLTGRTRHALLAVPASTGPDGVPLVAGHRWDSAEAADIIHRQAGEDARLVADDTPARFDILNLLVATDGAIARFGYDSRRLRPNIVVSGVAAELEPALPGQALAVGEALIGVHSVRQRCIVTTIDPDTGEQDLDVFRRIRNVFGGELALNCWVIRPGIISVGDRVDVVAADAVPADIGGWIVGAPYDPP
ncbi:MAG TPA: MOSC N-terminal beta barrel domain-containing protein [Frankiaceae bacterium]|jgi:hypothetical protein|nr:MOSC N-terminal beta barrel domain-containing protein [Frankiaceae bacterium]